MLYMIDEKVSVIIMLWRAPMNSVQTDQLLNRMIRTLVFGICIFCKFNMPLFCLGTSCSYSYYTKSLFNDPTK